MSAGEPFTFDDMINKRNFTLTDAGAERCRVLEVQVANLVTLVAAQERLIQDYQELVTILKQARQA